MKRRIKRYRVKCQCGCGQHFKANRPDQIYKDHAHQQAAYRQRLRVAEQAEQDRQAQQAREDRDRQKAAAEKKRMDEIRAAWADRWNPHPRQVELVVNHPSKGQVYLVSEIVDNKSRWKMQRRDGQDYVAVTTNGKDEFWWLLSEWQQAYQRKKQNEPVTYPAFRS